MEAPPGHLVPATPAAGIGDPASPAAADGILRLLDERIDRNRDVVSSQEQAVLQSARILIAGCGSVGGSAVEPLARMGVGALVLADPEDFDLSNINRQACVMADIGRNKAEVLAARARAINPLVGTRVLAQGITEQNVADALSGVDLVFDGIDAGAAPVEKYLVHARACANRIPVMAGMDFGGKAVVYVFDYRRRGTRPFFGMADEQAHRERDFAACLKWLGYRHFPADFLPVITERLASKRPWPQLAYCVQAMGALSSRCALDLLMGRRVPRVVSFDTHMRMRSHARRLAAYAAIPLRLLDAVRTSRGSGPQHAVAAPAADAEALPVPEALRVVVEAMRLAPSPHNCQPWRLDKVDRDTLAVSIHPGRTLPCVDPQGHGLLTSLGCAVEAAATVAHVAFDAARLDAADGAGILHVQGLRLERLWRDRALLQRRATNRHPYLADPVPPDVRDACVRASCDLDARVVFARPDLHELRRLVREGALRLFREPAYLDELLAHLRFTGAEEVLHGSGMTPRGLALDRVSALALRALRASPALRAAGLRLGLPPLMAASAARCVTRTGSFVLVTGRDTRPGGRVAGGRALMRTWLELTRHGFACQPMDFPVSFDAGRAGVMRMFGAGPGEYPVALLRVGRPTVAVPPAAPRIGSPRLLAGPPRATG